MNEQGFTFIELLLVVSFVILMAAISGTQYNHYKRESFNAATSSDFRNSMSYIEVYLQDNEAYPNCNYTNCETILNGFRMSPGVQINYTGVADTDILGVACHLRGDMRLVFTGIPGIIVGMRTGPCGS